MAAKFSVALVDYDGVPITDADVDLYTSEGEKAGDFTSNGDGTYYISVASTGKYTVWVNGHPQSEMTNIYIVVDDVLLQSNLDGVTLEFSGGVAQVKNAGISKGKIASDVAGDGLIQNADGSLSPNPDDTTLEIDSTSKKLQVKDSGISTAKLDATLQALLSTLQSDVSDLQTATALSFASETILDASKSIAQNLERLQNAIATLNSSASIYHLLYSDHETDTAPSGSLTLPTYTIAPSTSSYVDLAAFAYQKQPGIRVAKIIFEAKYSSHPMYGEGTVQLYLNSGYNWEKVIPDVVTWTKYEFEIDIEKMDITTLNTVRVRGKNTDNAENLLVRNIQVYAY